MAVPVDPPGTRLLLVPTHAHRGRTMSDTSAQLDGTALAKALRGWLPERRWFGGKGRSIRSVKVVSQTCLRDDDPTLHHMLIEVSYGDGQPEIYQVPVGVASTVPEHLTGVEIGAVGSATAYDALHDADF